MLDCYGEVKCVLDSELHRQKFKINKHFWDMFDKKVINDRKVWRDAAKRHMKVLC